MDKPVLKKLLLIDGHSIMYRAFYAIPDLSTSSGRPTNAVYGFIRMIRQAERITGSSHVAVVFDGGLSSKRLSLHAAYKAQRPPMPDAMREQFPIVDQYLAEAGIPRYRIDGQEADDLIASLVRKALPYMDRIVILTSDKDFFQLVDDQVHLVSPSDPRKEIDSFAVANKTGVQTGNIVEWLALCGDSSDNIEGVPGVGEKTAAKLLSEYGSISLLMSSLNMIKSDRIRKALENSRQIIERNVQLITLQADVAVDFDLKLAEKSPSKQRNLAAFLRSYEFFSIANEVDGGQPTLNLD